jgi:DNA polymerase III delta prime subunit
MKHVVVYGPAGCGKTRNKNAIAKALGCRNVKEEPDHLDLSGQRCHTVKTLFLVTADTYKDPRVKSADVRLFTVMPFSEAAQAAGVAA